MRDRAVDALQRAHEDLSAELEMEDSQGVTDPFLDFDDDDLANSDPRMIALEEISGTLELLEEPAE